MFRLLSLSVVFLCLLNAVPAHAQYWQSTTRSTGGVATQDVYDRYSPGNLHLNFLLANGHWGRTANIGAAFGATAELSRVFSAGVYGAMPYYTFDRSDRRERWFQAEGFIAFHKTTETNEVGDFTLDSSSSSYTYGGYQYSSSYRSWVNMPARHRRTLGARLGVLYNESPSRIEVGGNEVFPTAGYLSAFAGLRFTDAMDRMFYVDGYGYRGSTWWNQVSIDLLVGVAQEFAVDLTPDEDPSRVGFRMVGEQILNRSFGLSFRGEFGLQPMGHGWYAQLGVGFGNNIWVGQEY